MKKDVGLMANSNNIRIGNIRDYTDEGGSPLPRTTMLEKFCMVGFVAVSAVTAVPLLLLD